MYKKPQANWQYEWRVTYQRENWVKPRSRYFQMGAYATRFADRLEPYREGGGWLKLLHIHRRPVGVWVEWDEDETAA